MHFFLLLGFLAIANGHSFKTIYSWKQLEFDFPNETIREAYRASADYIPENNIPVGLNVWKNKMFMTVPRWKKGVPANLNFFWMNGTDTNSPALTPYPDLESNDIHSPTSSIVSIFRVRIDSCNRLWGIDTGIDDILGETRVVKPTELIVIDLKTDKIILRYPLKDTDQKSDSFFADLVIDVDSKSCDDAHAYLSDLGGYGMVIYSLARNDSWRINHNYFHFDPLWGDYNVSGINFQWTDGLFGMSLSPVQPDGHRTLYFHAMSSITEFSVSTSVLKNQESANSNNYYAFQVVGNKGPMTQGTSSVVDEKTGIAYFLQLNKDGVACWDTKEELNSKTFILAAKDNKTMVFPNDLIIDPPSNNLYVLSDNLAKFHYTSLSKSEENFFVDVSSLDELTKICKSSM